MQDIPYDVWLHIASFLSPDEVSNLYTLNSTWLGLALDARYKTAFIGSLHRRATERSLNRLTDPKIAPRVRSLTFRPGHLCKILQSKKQTPAGESGVSEILKAFQNLSIQTRKALGFNELSMPPDVVKKNLMKIMSLLTCLKSLRIEVRGEEHLYFSQSSEDFFAPGWSAFKDNLTSLDLRVTLEDLRKVLPAPPKDTLTSLETLSVQIMRASITTDAIAIVKDTLVPFINKQYRTLRTLELDVAEQVSMSPLLLNLVHMPLLSSFKLKQRLVSQEELDFSGLKHFFETHRYHLDTLDIGVISTCIYYPTPFPFFSQDCFQVFLPRLQHLILDLHDFPLDYLVGLIPFIRGFNTLLSLDVVGHEWSFESLRELIFPSGWFSKLRSLKLTVFLFTPLVLATLAECLPTLESLHIGFSEIGPVGFFDIFTEEIPWFVYELEQRVFPSWHLHSLDFERPLHTSPALRQRYKIALVQALPSVQMFSGLSREEYIATSAPI